MKFWPLQRPAWMVSVSPAWLSYADDVLLTLERKRMFKRSIKYKYTHGLLARCFPSPRCGLFCEKKRLFPSVRSVFVSFERHWCSYLESSFVFAVGVDLLRRR